MELQLDVSIQHRQGFTRPVCTVDRKLALPLDIQVTAIESVGQRQGHGTRPVQSGLDPQWQRIAGQRTSIPAAVREERAIRYRRRVDQELTVRVQAGCDRVTYVVT